MREVFIDSGYLLALELRIDQNHERALEHWRSRKERGLPRLVATSYVFDEATTYLNVRRLHASAVKVGRRLLESPWLELVHVGEDLFRRGFDLLQRRPDKRYSLTDCISFVLMEERGISLAYAFSTGTSSRRASARSLGRDERRLREGLQARAEPGAPEAGAPGGRVREDLQGEDLQPRGEPPPARSGARLLPRG